MSSGPHPRSDWPESGRSNWRVSASTTSPSSIAAAELGLDLDGPIERLTLTGGLTFSGGPGNNYTSHGIASLVPHLREHPDAVGMATGLGWFATKHAVGLYSGRPPEGPGFRAESVQSSVDALARRTARTDVEGPVALETFTVIYDREGAPEKAIIVARTGDGARVWANSTEPDLMATLVGSEILPTAGLIDPAGRFRLR
jgi:acetyl-CoA C-acetyltransferase